MNYLAHLHLAAMTDTSPTGNLLGDFVKGQVSGLNYNDKIKQGIQLHRSIDTFTDSHSYTKSLTRELGCLRRYGGIIIDVLYDHQLATNFANFYHNSLPVFAQYCYIQLDTNIKHLPDKYITTVSAMKQMDWLSGYGDMDNIERALTGISRRLKKPVELTESLDWYLENQAAIEQDFPEFYNDLIDYAVKTAASNR